MSNPFSKPSNPLIATITGSASEWRAIAIHHEIVTITTLSLRLKETFPKWIRFETVGANEAIGDHGHGSFAIFAEGPARQLEEIEAWASGFLAGRDSKKV